MKKTSDLFIGLSNILLLLATPFLLMACQTSNNVKNEQGTMMSESGMIGNKSCSCHDDSDSQHEACDADKIGKK